jgi:hypothetical protein
MYGASRFYPTSYAGGTGAAKKCDATVNEGGLPADATFWNVLADADPDKTRATSALQFALEMPARAPGGKYTRRGLWVYDKDSITPEGGPLQGAGSVRNAPVNLAGVRFTTFGNGIQWEVTAGAVMAMVHYKRKYGPGTAMELPKRIEEARRSLRTLLKMYKGVPQSVLGGTYHRWQTGKHIGEEFPGGTDTGLGWPYLRYLGTVTTAWAGLALLYQTDPSEAVNEDANPFVPPKSPVPAGKDLSCLPAKMSMLGVPPSFVN